MSILVKGRISKYEYKNQGTTGNHKPSLCDNLYLIQKIYRFQILHENSNSSTTDDSMAWRKVWAFLNVKTYKQLKAHNTVTNLSVVFNMVRLWDGEQKIGGRDNLEE